MIVLFIGHMYQTVNPPGAGAVACLGCVVVCVTWLFWSFHFLNAMICSSPVYSRKKSIDEICSFFSFSNMQESCISLH